MILLKGALILLILVAWAAIWLAVALLEAHARIRELEGGGR